MAAGDPRLREKRKGLASWGADKQGGLCRPAATVGRLLRQELKEACFGSWDADGDGHLNKAEMRTFAGYVGFDGTDEDWDREYHTICEEAGVKPSLGVPRAVVMQLLDDQSDKGCYCSDEEMMAILGVGDERELFGGGPHELQDDATTVRMSEEPWTEDDATSAGMGGAEDDKTSAGMSGAEEDATSAGASGPEDDATSAGISYDEDDATSAGISYEEDDATSAGISYAEDVAATPAGSEATPSTSTDSGGSGSGRREVALGSHGGSLFARVDYTGARKAPLRRVFMREGNAEDLYPCRQPRSPSSPSGSSPSRAPPSEATAGGRAATLAASDAPPTARGGDGRTVVFHGAPCETSESRLLSLFRTAGAVEAFGLFTRAGSGSRGMGVVRYQSAEGAHLAVDTLSGVSINGRTLVASLDDSGDVLDGREGLRFSPLAGGGEGQARLLPRDPEESSRPGRTPSCGSSCVFFAGAPREVSLGRLRACFEEYGPVLSMRLLGCPQSGRSRGMGNCTFADPDSARRALEGGLEVDGWRLSLREESTQHDPSMPSEPASGCAEALRAAARSGQPDRRWCGKAHGRPRRSSPYGQAGAVGPRRSVFFAGAPPDAMEAGAVGPRRSVFFAGAPPDAMEAGAMDPRRSVCFASASPDTREAAVFEHFEEVGRVRRMKLFTAPDGRSRGMGVVEYFTAAAAARAFYNLHGLALEGWPVAVSAYC